MKHQYNIEEHLLYLFSVGLKTELETIVKGSIYIEPKDDNLHITIHSQLDKPFTYTIYNIIDKIVQGISSKQFAQMIVKTYRQHIIFVFFR